MTETQTKPLSWEKFRRYANLAPGAKRNDFYGCVDKNGDWFDSAASFDVAVHWCCCYAGRFDLLNDEDKLKWMNDEGRKLGYSVIHGTQIKRMYEAGLIN